MELYEPLTSGQVPPRRRHDDPLGIRRMPLAPLPTFDPDGTCPRCRQPGASSRWVEGHVCDRGASATCAEPDRIERRCHTCEATWAEAPVRDDLAPPRDQLLEWLHTTRRWLRPAAAAGDADAAQVLAAIERLPNPRN